MAEELANFSEYVGGPEYAHYLLNPLENLASVEEVLVRDKVTKTCFFFLNKKKVTHTLI